MRIIKILLLSVLCLILSGTAIQLKNIKVVNGTKIKQSKYIETINVSGEFVNENRTEMKFSYPLFVKEVYVKENDYISRGQALFSIDTDKMQSVMSGDITEEMINSISYTDLSSVNDYSVFMKYTDIADTVYAPSDGIITEMNIHDGALVMKDNNVITVSDGNTVMARFSVLQSDFGRVKVGDAVNITPVAFQNHSYSGKITDKNAVIRKQVSITGSKVMIDVYASIDNPDSMISDGLQLTGKIINDKGEIKNMLSYDYLNQDENGEYVFVFNEGNAEKVYITTGVETESAAEILTAFSENTVFLSGELKNGDRVIIKAVDNEFI